MVFSLNVKQEVWDESIYGGNLVKGLSYESSRVKGFEGKKSEVEKSWWEVILRENDFCKFKEEGLIDMRT